MWGASRIHGELLMLGFEVAQSTVSRYIVRVRNPPSQTWKTFLRNHAEAITAIDMCVVPTVSFDRLFAVLVLGHGRRQLLWCEVTRHPTAEWLARQITEAFPWTSTPAYLLRDNDRAYGHVFTSRVRAMGIRDRPISPQSPWQNGYAERLIGTLRRECLDHMIIFGETHLRRILCAYAAYYNQGRTHLALQKDAPLHRAPADWSHCRHSHLSWATSPIRPDIIFGKDRLQLLHEAVPSAKVMALLVNPANSTVAETQSREAFSVAPTLSVDLHVLHASTERDLDAVFANLIQSRAGGLVIAVEPLFSNWNKQFAELTVRHAVPAIAGGRDFAAAGGLLSYGADTRQAYRLAGIYTGRVLKGEKPANLPVQQSTKVELIINLKTAKTLGLNIPNTLIGRADEVIE